LTLVLLMAVLSPPGCRAGATQPMGEHFVFLASGMTAESRRTAAGAIYALVGKHALPGENIHLLAAPDDRVIGSLTTPSGSPNRRLRHHDVQPALRGLARYFGEATTASVSHSGEGLQLQLPEIPARVSRLRRTHLAPHVILCGSPLYHDPRRLNWSMSLGHVPLYGSLNATGSPWNEGMERFPEGTSVAFYTPDVFGLDGDHRSEIVRWVRYAYGERGAQVLAVTPDATTAFTADRVLFPQPVTPRKEGSGMRLVVDTSNTPPTDATVPPMAPSVPAPLDVKTPTATAPIDHILAAPPVLESLKGKLQNVVFLRDLSLSMLEDSEHVPTPEINAAVIADVQDKLLGLPLQRFALVGFGGKLDKGDEARLVYYPSRFWTKGWSDFFPAVRQNACRAMAKWQVAGGTPTYDALVAARQLEGVDTILLWTDGLPGIPVDGDAQGRILRLAEEMAAEGITINCIGVGNLSGRGGGVLDLEGAEFLRRLARTTRGEYFAL
jgi:hypothetical protein